MSDLSEIDDSNIDQNGNLERDHRFWGKRLELFHFEPTAPGMPYWLPNGLKVLNELIAFFRKEHEERGYHEIATPLINEKRLWEISGHWEQYHENMFIMPISEHVVYGLKPMNCPNAMIVFGLKVRSYRDLPLRFSDLDVLHRRELSGTLSGLLRVQKFQQDDAHIFISEDMIEEEYARILDLADRFYRIFDLKYCFRLSKRPESFIGDLETWDRAEQALKRILDQRVGDGGYVVAEGEGAFYGPKIDILVEDSLGRSWQVGTIQLDFQLPRRFDLVYRERNGELIHPVVIHRVIYGSLDRFLGILLEHARGALPVWLSPLKAVVAAVSDKHEARCREISDELKKAGIASEVDVSDCRIAAKVRQFEERKIPYLAVIGDRELESSSLMVRKRGGEPLGSFTVSDFIDLVKADIAARR